MSNIILGKIDISSLIKASNTLDKFYKNSNSEQEQAGTIQAFEFCYELSWKTMKRILAFNGQEVSSPRATFRAAAAEGLIQNIDLWFKFIEMRNKTSYVYDESIALDIFEEIPIFMQELKLFISDISKL